MSSGNGHRNEETVTRTRRRAFTASLVGTSLEWYDYFIFASAAALVFNKLFFPSFDPLTGTLLSLATFTAGFVVRPLGAMVFGHFGDRVGRKQALTMSLLIVGASTFLIGALPTYASVGVLAPVLLVLLRMAQGFALGGEWGGAVLISMEHGPQSRRGLFATGPQLGVPIGNLLSAGVFALLVVVLSEDQLLAWGWRIPFLLSGLLLGVGLYARLALEESPAFLKASASREIVKAPVLETVRRHPRPLSLAIGARLGTDVAYYIFAVFILVYGTEELGLSRSQVLNGVLIGSAIQLFLIPWLGSLSDRVGRRVIYLVGAVAATVWVFAFFPLMDTKQVGWVYVAAAGGFVAHGAMYAVQSSFIAELFPARVRYTGTSMGYQLESIIGGGLAPIIAVALLAETGGTLAVSLYTAAALAVTFACVAIARETSGRVLDGFEEPALDVRTERKPLFVRGEEAEKVEAGERV
ncbi:MAG: MFS transporter [Solirubrobacteraceae bacterium]